MQLAIPFSNGVDRSNDETRLPEGFCRVITNAIYNIDDPDRLHKHPGRTVACTLASPLTTTPYGLRHIQFDATTSQIGLLANGLLYHQNEGTTLVGSVHASDASLGWVSYKDADGTAFTRTGTFLKVVHDGLNRWVAWTGATDERALLIDADNNARFLGLLQPDAITLTNITASPSAIRPTSDAVATGSVTVGGASLTFSGTTGFVNPVTTGDGTNDATKSYDTDLTTFSQLSVQTASTQGSVFTFDSATWTSQILYVTLDSTMTNVGGGGAGGLGTPNVPIVYVQLSTNGGSTYSTIWQARAPFASTVISKELANGTTSVIKVRIFIRYVSGTSKVDCNCYDIRRQAASGSAAVTDGTYYYAETEVYRTTLSTGDIFEVESLPSKMASVTLTNNTTVTAIQVNLSTRKNTNAMGVKNDVENGKALFRRLYRTTKTGSPPDLGFIGEAQIDDTAFIDTFAVTATTLGLPPLNVAYAQNVAVYANETPPAIWDATMSRAGILFLIPMTRDRVRWCMPGQVDYLPSSAHDLALLPTDRNDKLVGVTSIGDAVLIMSRTRIWRLIDIPIVNQPNFDVNRIQLDILSPVEGLAAGPRGYCSFATQAGRAAVAWVSDNGVWMTDGTLVSERGMGIKKLSVNMDWSGDVDTTRLAETELAYDPILQMVIFDYFDPSGNRRSYYLHIHPDHWVATGQDMDVPKLTGPHTNQTVLGRTFGEIANGGFRHWSLNASKVFNERSGTQDNSADITTTITSGFVYPSGPIEEFDVFFAGAYHNDWGSTSNNQVSLAIAARRDQTGITQTVSKTISFQNAAVTRTFQHLSGQAFKVTLTHTGTTISPGSTAMLAFGPVVLDGESMGELERD